MFAQTIGCFGPSWGGKCTGSRCKTECIAANAAVANTSVNFYKSQLCVASGYMSEFAAWYTAPTSQPTTGPPSSSTTAPSSSRSTPAATSVSTPAASGGGGMGGACVALAVAVVVVDC